MKRLLALFLALSLLGGLTACGSQSSPETETTNGNASSPAVEAPEESGTAEPDPSLATQAQPEEPVYPDPAEELPSTKDYIHQVVREHIDQIEQPGMTEFEKVKAATDYLIALGYYCQSPALDVWRWRTAGDTMPTYEEMRALNMLLFGAETCEGYTSTLNLLLEEMGIETRYMTGMTYSVRGDLVYHSWSQVKVDGVWYHLDSDLTDNIARDGVVNYRYFLKGDATMSASHFWGQRLIDLGRLEPKQVEEVRANYMGEICPQDYPTPAASVIAVTPKPDINAIREELNKELAAYEERYGKLEYMELDILPPVFIRGHEFSEDEPLRQWAADYQALHCLIPPPGQEIITGDPFEDWDAESGFPE